MIYASQAKLERFIELKHPPATHPPTTLELEELAG